MKFTTDGIITPAGCAEGWHEPDLKRRSEASLEYSHPRMILEHERVCTKCACNYLEQTNIQEPVQAYVLELKNRIGTLEFKLSISEMWLNSHELKLKKQETFLGWLRS